ncbi:hypothetical protein BDV97DRAFT_352904 [Delphinella strobiligena]|nr:hypothetical protein BDV97DRAFT_352904 [Delphinella strobiligena]
MPPLPGETLLLTLFADVHYYFNPPSSRPVHDRFDRGSYVYLYHNTTQRKARIEVANAAGTPDQDAFNGYLDTVLVKNKYQQSNLFSITADASPSSPTSRQPDQSLWRLPAYDLKNEQRYLYRLHSLDLYFWAANDANRFLDYVKRLLPQYQLEITEPPSAIEHRDSMSPVVEKLEQAAIYSPLHNRAPSALSSQTALSTSPLQPRATVAPYNPAAPAAPEPIAHREKTPPPEDAATGTGLTAVSMQGQAPQFATASPLAHHPSYQPTSQQHSFPGPPPTSSLSASSTPYQTSGYETSFSPPPTAPLSPSPGQTSFHGHTHQPQTQYAGYPHQRASSYSAVQTPGMPPTPSAPPPYGQVTPLQSPTMPQHPSLQSPGLPPPPAFPSGGYSNYTHCQPSQHPQAQSEPYQVHSQVYKPTEVEAAHGHGHGHGHGHSHRPAQPFKAGLFEDRVGKLEKGVGRFLKKLDQKI